MLKKFNMLILFVLCFLFVGTVSAMPYSEVFKSDKFSNNDSDKIYEVTNAYKDNGVIDGYIAVGTSSTGKVSNGLVVKYDSDFNIIKSVSYDCNCAFSTIIPSYSKDGIVDGYVVTSNLGESVLLIKYDLNLEVVSRVSNDGSEVALNSVDYSYDENGNVDGYIYLAEVFSFSTYSVDALVYKYDLDLNLIWKNSIASYYADAYSGVVSSYKDGKIDGYILTGYTFNSSATEFVQKIDLSGNVVWTKNIVLKDSKYSVTDLSLAYDGNKPIAIIAVAKTSNISVDTEYGVVARISFDGELESVKEMTNLVNSGFEQIIPNKNEKGVVNGYIIAGYTDFKSYKEDAKSLLMLEVDNELNVKWSNAAEGFRYYKDVIYSYDKNGILDGLFTISCPGSGLNEKELAIKYQIKKYNIKVNGINGSVSSSLEISKEGETITFESTGNSGYVLDSIKVVTVSGIEIEVTNNSFVMPNEDVSIEVVYKLVENSETKNPDTYGGLMVVLLIAFVLSIMNFILLKRNKVSIV